MTSRSSLKQSIHPEAQRTHDAFHDGGQSGKIPMTTSTSLQFGLQEVEEPSKVHKP